MAGYFQSPDMPNSPFVEADYNYRVKRDAADSGSGYQADIDRSDYSVKIDPVIWRKVFIPQFTEALASKKILQKADVLEFVPMLIDPGFTKEFAKKLSLSDEVCREYAHELVDVCFRDRKEDLARIQREMFLPFLEKLKSTRLLDAYDVGEFVPMLTDPAFTTVFAKKLLASDADVRLVARHEIDKRYKDHPEDLTRIYKAVFIPEYMKKLNAQKSLVIYDIPHFTPMLIVPEFAQAFSKQLFRRDYSAKDRKAMISYVHDQINTVFKDSPDLSRIQQCCQKNFGLAAIIKQGAGFFRSPSLQTKERSPSVSSDSTVSVRSDSEHGSPPASPATEVAVSRPSRK
ncbi:MAG: hypothetical protein A3F43_05870 [Gammaproteobacteria bacterium RIFCSPHIGHO2_12_FULL_42_10]|nr:MAG: hypothetical protein A3F43_05870 [Gammaproteobacteria bacterium RIFCSPHIGHO2_12_FULL_42_10]